MTAGPPAVTWTVVPAAKRSKPDSILRRLGTGPGEWPQVTGVFLGVEESRRGTPIYRFQEEGGGEFLVPHYACLNRLRFDDYTGRLVTLRCFQEPTTGPRGPVKTIRVIPFEGVVTQALAAQYPALTAGSTIHLAPLAPPLPDDPLADPFNPAAMAYATEHLGPVDGWRDVARTFLRGGSRLRPHAGVLDFVFDYPQHERWNQPANLHKEKSPWS